MADRNHGQPPKEEDKEKKETEVKVKRDSDDRPQVRRRLDFGQNIVKEAVDINNVLDLSSEKIQEHRQKAIERWNFDFENEIPLEGNWEWEKVPVRSTESKEIVCSMEKKCKDNRTV